MLSGKMSQNELKVLMKPETYVIIVLIRVQTGPSASDSDSYESNCQTVAQQSHYVNSKPSTVFVKYAGGLKKNEMIIYLV